VAAVTSVCHVNEREKETKSEEKEKKTRVSYVCDSSRSRGDVGLVNDGFSLVRRVGGPDGVRVNEAHAPHRGEQRFKREALFLSRPTPSRRSRAHPLGSGSACRAASRRVASRHVASRRDERRARENTLSPYGGGAEPFSQLAVMARPAASVSVN